MLFSPKKISFVITILIFISSISYIKAEDLDVPAIIEKAHQGDSQAECMLGELYLHGIGGLPVNVKKAISWIEKSAKQGNSNGETELGYIYLNAETILFGFSKNIFIENIDQVKSFHKEAGYWYKRAADQGNVNAQYSLGQMYANGDGLPRDHKKALYWYKKAAAQGDKEAKKELIPLLDENDTSDSNQ